MKSLIKSKFNLLINNSFIKKLHLNTKFCLIEVLFSIGLPATQVELTVFSYSFLWKASRMWQSISLRTNNVNHLTEKKFPSGSSNTHHNKPLSIFPNIKKSVNKHKTKFKIHTGNKKKKKILNHQFSHHTEQVGTVVTL